MCCGAGAGWYPIAIGAGAAGLAACLPYSRKCTTNVFFDVSTAGMAAVAGGAIAGAIGMLVGARVPWAGTDPGDGAVASTAGCGCASTPVGVTLTGIGTTFGPTGDTPDDALLPPRCMAPICSATWFTLLLLLAFEAPCCLPVPDEPYDDACCSAGLFCAALECCCDPWPFPFLDCCELVVLVLVLALVAVDCVALTPLYL
uniref:Uncharacterized protein n=1 Tax=Anopheles coluzzii TaxID=1518534 RepID=A0A8W7P7D3_ANOCL